MGTLYGIRQSPFTERALWALDHHGVVYDYHEHLPMLGEPLLRLKVRGLGLAKATVPVYEVEGKVRSGGLEIARHADSVGAAAAALIPVSLTDDVVRWVELADRVLDVGRAWVLQHLATDRAAQREAVPSFVPGFVRGALAPTAATVARFLKNKHGAPDDVDGEIARVVRPALEEVRSALRGRDYLLSEFSFADVSMGAALGIVRPRAEAPLRPGTRAMWTHEGVASEFADLLAWRDRTYERHRPRRTK